MIHLIIRLTHHWSQKTISNASLLCSKTDDQAWHVHGHVAYHILSNQVQLHMHIFVVTLDT